LQITTSTSNPWRSNRLFDGLSDEQLNKLAPNLYFLKYIPAEEIMKQGEDGDFVFLIQEGSAEIYNDELLLSVLKPGDIAGLMSIMDEKPRSATVIAGPSGAEGYGIRKESLKQLFNEPDTVLTNKLLINYIRNQQERVRNTNQLGLKEARARLEHEKKRTLSAHFFAQMVLGLIVFIFLLSFLTDLAKQIESTFISFAVLFAYSIWSYIFITSSRLDLRRFGLTMANFRPALSLAMRLTIPFITFLFGLKWLLITIWPAQFGNKVIDFYLLDEHGAGYTALVILVYSLHAALQEFIARSCIQGGLMEFVAGKWAEWKSIILASLMFSSFHLMLDIRYGLLTIVPGLLWGYQFYRYRNLLAVSISHILIGITALFVLKLLG